MRNFSKYLNEKIQKRCKRENNVFAKDFMNFKNFKMTSRAVKTRETHFSEGNRGAPETDFCSEARSVHVDVAALVTDVRQ